MVFHETGLAHFTRQPAHELFGKSLSLQHIFDQQSVRDVHEKIAETTTDLDRIKVVEDFLLYHLRTREQDMLVGKALYHIHQSKGTVRISALASALCTSRSPLEKKFRSITGASPKKFAGIVRARAMMAALEQGRQNEAEYLSAYYDQAHFIKDFRKFTAVTPEEYLKNMKRFKPAR